MMFEWMSIILYQVINVNSTTPCFLNYTSPNLWKDCGVNKDFLQASLVSWQWVTGGWFPMILVGILCTFTYIKYHKAVYPMLIGVLFIPVSYFLFPAQFLNFAILMAAIGLGILIWYIVVSQTNEQ